MSTTTPTASPIRSGSTWDTRAHPDASGRLVKPLFAFLVIGLNGRIPLNTAGNLAGAGATHAAHVGTSDSEVDPTYALQNANQGPAIDADPLNFAGVASPPYTSNTQIDNAGIDVRLTQLRNLLAGTRPQPNPTTSEPMLADPRGTTNGDDNLVFGTWAGVGGGQPYFLPNGIADPGDILISTNPPRVRRTTAAVAGRWGEPTSIPGTPFAVAGGPVLNLVANTYNNPVRAGYSFGLADLLNGAPRAAADDNYNQFDPFPIGHAGELNDRDLFDPAGGLLLPVDRMRRFVTLSTSTARARCSDGASPGRPATSGPTPSEAGRLRRLFPPTRLTGGDQRRSQQRGDARARSSIPRPTTTSSTRVAPTRPT